MARESLPPGFRFHPTDAELILYYLKRKVLGKNLRIHAITELDLYKFAPWELPEKSCLRSKDREWYFFCPRDKKYANGSRTNRATEVGYWKTTGRDRGIYNDSVTVGMKKTLIFHLGRAPQGNRTNWVMHEYRLQIKELYDAGISQDSYVLCKIFEKSGAGPKNGEQHGAPFREEEWEDDVVEISLAPLPLADRGSPSIIMDNEKVAVPGDSKPIPVKACDLSLGLPCQNGSSDASRENLSLQPPCRSSDGSRENLSLQPPCGSSDGSRENRSSDGSGENVSLPEDVDMGSTSSILAEENGPCHSGKENGSYHSGKENDPCLSGKVNGPCQRGKEISEEKCIAALLSLKSWKKS